MLTLLSVRLFDPAICAIGYSLSRRLLTIAASDKIAISEKEDPDECSNDEKGDHKLLHLL